MFTIKLDKCTYFHPREVVDPGRVGENVKMLD